MNCLKNADESKINEKPENLTLTEIVVIDFDSDKKL